MKMYGIKNCDTVKKAQTFLQQHRVAFTFHDLRTDGLSREQVSRWLNAVGVEALVNKRSTTWKQLTDAERANLTAATALELCLAHPTLIKRPVLETADGVEIGFSESRYQRFV